MAAARSSWDRTEVTDPLGKAGPSFGNAWGQDGRGECLASNRPPVSQTRSSFWDTSAPSCCVSLLSPNKLLILIARPCSAFLLPWGGGGSLWGTSLLHGATDHQSSQEGGGKAQLCWRDTSQWRQDTGPRGCGSSLAMLWPLEFVVCGHGASRGDLTVSTLLEIAAPCSWLRAASPTPLIPNMRQSLSLSALLSGVMAAIQ